MSLIPVTIFGAQLTAAEVLFVQNLSGLSYAQGDILYYNSGNLTRLAIGTATQVLTVNAGATAPEWGSVAGSGTVTTVSVVTANGISGSVANATSTPAITLTLGAITPTSISMTSALTVTPTSDVISGTFRRNGAGQTSNIIEIQTEVNALLASVDKTGKFTMPALNISGLTASEIVITDASKNIVSAAVATYPSLTELTYLKGVTSAIQTQINAKGAGTVTSVGFTGGLISVATATTTPAFTVAGTSGGIPYFSSASTWATSAALAANALVVGGGAGVAPSTVTTGTGVLTALAVNVGSAGAFVTFNGALGTPSSGTVTNLTGTASININGTVGATTPTTIVATTIQANTGLVPDANDGAYLGTSALGFSDLFLASGAVIDFANANSVITHSSGILTVSTGDLRVTTAGTNTASVVTVGGTQTLTGKTLTSPTLTTPGAFTTGGTITLAENTSIALDPAGSADGKYTGITIAGTGGATIAFGRLVYLKAADSRWWEADADASATAGPVMMGMTVTSTTAGAAVTVLLVGQIRADASFPALTIGAPVYAGETAGDIQVAIPTGADNVIRVVGFALTADEIYFNPSQDHQITVA